MSEWSPPAGRPRGGALTIKGAFSCGTPASVADPTYSDFWWTLGLGRPPYPLRDLPHFHGSPRTWDLGHKHQILTKWVPIELHSVGSESAPHFNIGPCGRGFELSRRRKKRAIGTCPYSPVSGWSPPAGRPRGGALTIKKRLLL